MYVPMQCMLATGGLLIIDSVGEVKDKQGGTLGEYGY